MAHIAIVPAKSEHEKDLIVVSTIALRYICIAHSRQSAIRIESKEGLPKRNAVDFFALHLRKASTV